MSPRPSSGSPTDSGLIAGVLARLNPAFIGFAIIVSLLLLTGVLGLAVQKGSEISILGIRIGARVEAAKPERGG